MAGAMHQAKAWTWVRHARSLIFRNHSSAKRTSENWLIVMVACEVWRHHHAPRKFIKEKAGGMVRGQVGTAPCCCPGIYEQGAFLVRGP